MSKKFLKILSLIVISIILLIQTYRCTIPSKSIEIKAGEDQLYIMEKTEYASPICLSIKGDIDGDVVLKVGSGNNPFRFQYNFFLKAGKIDTVFKYDNYYSNSVFYFINNNCKKGYLKIDTKCNL